MDFISNQQPQIEEMLKVIGVEKIEDLFQAIPKELRLPRPVDDDGISEYEGISELERLSRLNTFTDYDHYLGGGAYDHYVPALVPSICGKSEFLTSYTPYQPEVSQGYLQVIFEFQSAIATLTGLEIANASVYDGGSACAEGLLMTLRAFRGKRKKVLIPASLNPHWRKVVDLYFRQREEEIVTIPFNEDGTLSKVEFDEETASILLPYPNFFGLVEDYKNLIDQAKEKNVLTVLAANPLVFGLYPTAKELGADICVGDGQPFGIPLNYGGPYVGFISCTKPLMRQLPGRLVGKTVDTKGNPGYVLTLQAREQHIRREKATSNICTNQALAALACLITMLWYGKEGLPELALTNFQRASYLREELSKIPGYTPLNKGPLLNEFVVKVDQSIDKFKEHLILPGIELSKYYKEFENHLLVCVTELKSKEDLDRYVYVAGA